MLLYSSTIPFRYHKKLECQIVLKINWAGPKISCIIIIVSLIVFVLYAGVHVRAVCVYITCCTCGRDGIVRGLRGSISKSFPTKNNAVIYGGLQTFPKYEVCFIAHARCILHMSTHSFDLISSSLPAVSSRSTRATALAPPPLDISVA